MTKKNWKLLIVIIILVISGLTIDLFLRLSAYNQFPLTERYFSTVLIYAIIYLALFLFLGIALWLRKKRFRQEENEEILF